MNSTAPVNLRRAAAAKYLQEKWGLPRSARTLAKLACVSSDGPPIVYFSRFPLYPIDGLDAYAQAQLSKPVRSTSQRPPIQNAAHSTAENEAA